MPIAGRTIVFSVLFIGRRRIGLIGVLALAVIFVNSCMPFVLTIQSQVRLLLLLGFKYELASELSAPGTRHRNPQRASDSHCSTGGPPLHCNDCVGPQLTG